MNVKLNSDSGFIKKEQPPTEKFYRYAKSYFESEATLKVIEARRVPSGFRIVGGSQHVRHRTFVGNLDNWAPTPEGALLGYKNELREKIARTEREVVMLKCKLAELERKVNSKGTP